MSVWEYKVITSGKGGFATPALLETFLNQLGKEEWEILHFQSQPDNALAWRLLAEAYDSKGDPGMARLAAAEQNFYLGQLLEARTFAVHARELLKKDSPEWRRATDIILASKPTPDQLKELGVSG